MKLRKAIAGITAVSGIAVALVTGIVVAGYWKNPAQRDLHITLPPIIIPAILSVFAVMAMVSRSDSRKRIGAMMGTCIGSLLYLILPALQLALQYDLIAHDGTGFWAVIMLPSVYLGIPLPILGTLLGLAIGFIVDRVKRKSRGEPSPRPCGSPAAGSPSGQA
jgi:predicted histidine transporter YuiF (NhaC family)